MEYIAILIVGLIAGTIGTFVGGGGGLLSIPFLVLTGIPPHIAIATNRLAAIGATGTAFLRFLKSGKIIWPLVPIFIVLGVLGGFLGARLMVKTDDAFLETFIGLALLCLTPLIFVKKDFGIVSEHIPVRSRRFFVGCLLYFVLMIFGGFFGAGAGILFTILLVQTFGLTFLQAMATNNPPWLIMSISALVVLALEGLVDWAAGAFLFAGMSIGGWIGAGRAIHYGDQVVKKAFLAACILLGLLILCK